MATRQLSATKDRPRPRVWGKQIKRLKNDVLTALAVLRQPAVNNASERQRSRSPHGDNRSRQWTTSQNARLSRVSSRYKSDEHLRKQAIVDRLMSKTIVKFPDILETSETSHVPFDTQDLWIYHLHRAVDASPLCSWPRVMEPTDEGIHALGVATLNPRYRFMFRFRDDGSEG